MKNKKIIMTVAVVLLVSALLTVLVGCDTETRLNLVKGFDEDGLWLECGKWRDYVISMIDVEYTELADSDPIVGEVKEDASVVLGVYEGPKLTATAHVTNDCRILVEDVNGGLWFAHTPAVDTVLICAAFTEGGVEP